MTTMTNAWPVLLYDGTCGLCHAAVRLVLRHDRVGTLRFASLGGDYGQAVLAAHPELAGADTIVWLAPGGDDCSPPVTTRSEAALRIARYLGGKWRLALAARVVPRPIRDWVYDLVARHRRRLMGTERRCVVPPPDARHRFLDETG